MAKHKRPDTSQLDLFITFVGDVPYRDERESMSLPMVSLAKRKRVKPIEFTSPDGKTWVQVSAPAKHGIANIYDLDVIIWAISQLNEALEQGLPTSPVLSFHPYELLRSIHRETGGEHYERLRAALNRLSGTMIETSVRAEKRKRTATFHWLEDWHEEIDEATGRSKGMRITLPRWVYEAVVKERAVLRVSQQYFRLTSGLARWLYRLARRHAGKQEHGWTWRMQHLWARSGTTQPYGSFARDVRRIVKANALPEYRL